MSGITNRTGARSGVIGTITSAPVTAIDYEEGTWTPVNGNWTTFALGTYYATYTKIGNRVIVSVQTGGSSNASTSQYFQGLPFVSPYVTPGIMCDGSPNKFVGVMVNGGGSDDVYLVDEAWSDDNFEFTATYYIS
jgi:hypothetical protein